MASTSLITKYLPLSEATFYILISLQEPLHGYGIMQKVEQISERTVRLGPGTLYGALSSLEKEKLIEMTGSDDRRKCYRITSTGLEVLREQVRRLEIMVRNASQLTMRVE